MADMAGLLAQANYILDACGRQVPTPTKSWVDLPSHVAYTRFLDGTLGGAQDIGGIVHPRQESFMIRSLTAQALPRVTDGAYWRLRFPDGRYFQSKLSTHAMGFGLGSNRQLFSPAVEWRPGEKLFVDLDSIISQTNTSYSISMRLEGAYRFPISGPGAVSNPVVNDSPRYYYKENQNILAPEFRFAPACPSETPAGWEDEEFTYVTPAANLPINGAQVSNVQLQIDSYSDFIVRLLWPCFYGGPNQGMGTVTVRLRRGDGYEVSEKFLSILDVQGPVFKELRVKNGDNLYWDGRVVDGAGSPGNVITFGLYLNGVKRRRIQG